MSGTTNAGPAPRTNRVEPDHDKTDVRCPCGAEADGVDARDGLPTCADCARLETDGGDSFDHALRCLKRARELRREARQLEIAAQDLSREVGR